MQTDLQACGLRARTKICFTALKIRSEKAESISAEEFPIDYYRYIIRQEGDCEIQIDIERNYEIMFAGGSGGRDIKELRAIIKDIYSYYGVSQEDINNNSERFKSLMAILSSD